MPKNAAAVPASKILLVCLFAGSSTAQSGAPFSDAGISAGRTHFRDRSGPAIHVAISPSYIESRGCEF
jgi:hypothetical protein